MWIGLSLLGVVVLFFGGCVALIAIGTNSMESGGTDSSADGPTVSVGTSVRDGKFEFLVSDVSTPQSWYGEPRARGQWIIVTMTVTNIGDEPQSFFADNQKLIDTAGREYAPDTMAAISMNSGDSMVIDMNPGFNITVKVPFDVPPGTQASSVEVHDSAFSSGAKVTV